MHGILSDTAIRQAVLDGDINISPFNREHVNITSYDLTLGDQVLVYSEWVYNGHADPDLNKDAWGKHVDRPMDGELLYPKQIGVLDAKVEPKPISFTIDPKVGWLLKPGIGYLMHTRERVSTRKYNPILDGKSSIGRLFIQVHATAGYGDPGFAGQYTLEVIVQHPIRVYPGMRFCQIRFHTIAGELSTTYDKVGHYTGAQAQGANPSQAWRQFKTEV